MILDLIDEAATFELGGQLQRVLDRGMVVFLHGQLGAGKTTLVRAYLRAAGFRGAVKSPTFTLVEEYRLGEITVYHFDLYRLASADELEWLGFRDYLTGDSLCFIEWPERGHGGLPAPDIDITLCLTDRGRNAVLKAASAEGLAALRRIS